MEPNAGFTETLPVRMSDGVTPDSSSKLKTRSDFFNDHPLHLPWILQLFD